MTRLALATVWVAACNTSPSVQHAELARLAFDVPAGWTRADSTRRGIATAVWTPPDNVAKESISVIRSELAPQMVKADDGTLGRLLAAAQGADAKPSAARPVTTKRGLHGMRLESDFVPSGLRDHYHRVHVVLIDGTSLVHVLYTAKSPDAGLAALDTVLGSIREGEG